MKMGPARVRTQEKSWPELPSRRCPGIVCPAEFGAGPWRPCEKSVGQLFQYLHLNIVEFLFEPNDVLDLRRDAFSGPHEIRRVPADSAAMVRPMEQVVRMSPRHLDNSSPASVEMARGHRIKTSGMAAVGEPSQ